ncbi:MAG: hypothetical protein WCF90_09740 [Methanomicrobiales archaeon]
MFLDPVISENRIGLDTKFCYAIETRTDWSFKCRIWRADGEIRVIWSVDQYRDGCAGRFSRMAGIVQDIPERKRAKKVVNQTEEKLAFLLM